jgi:hypothetical protein
VCVDVYVCVYVKVCVFIYIYASLCACSNPSLTGAYQLLWVRFARFYEQHEDLDNARVVFKKAVKAVYTYVDALAAVYCAWVEMELRNKRYTRALNVAKMACVAPSRASDKRWKRKTDLVSLPVQERLFKSGRLWALYADLEENLGTLDTTKAVYNQMIELGIVTPQIILNFAKLLEDNQVSTNVCICACWGSIRRFVSTFECNSYCLLQPLPSSSRTVSASTRRASQHSPTPTCTPSGSHTSRYGRACVCVLV